jgi:signal transduction histidine kinase
MPARGEDRPHARRLAPSGPAFVAGRVWSGVARSVSVLAGADGRLRQQEAGTVRLLGMAREVGNRIRAHLRVEEVVQEASRAIEENVGADVAWVFLVQNGKVSPPVGRESDPLLPATYSENVPPGSAEYLEGMYRRGESVVIRDLRGPEGEWIAPEIRDPLLAAGIITHMLIPFGIGETMLGFITVERLYEQAWLPAEVHAVELIAADIGRALHHARLYEAETRLVAELRRVDEAKSYFLATVSHELRTPLTSILGYLEILQAGEPGPLTTTQARMLDSIDRNSTRLRRLIEDVLTMSKIESGSFTTTLRPVNVVDIVTSATDALQPQADAKGITLIRETPATGLLVTGDSDQLDRALMNLLSNAVKFTPPGGQVRVSAAAAAGPARPARPAAPAGAQARHPEPGDPVAGDPALQNSRTAVLTVRDTGIGIPEADKSRLFDRFYRASNAAERAIAGTGIGLTIVRTIVANHRGSMDLQSQEGEGTVVTVRLPLLEGQQPENDPAGKSLDTPPRPPPPGT